jgi:FtsP/CotA-like multicopper oxidase with cupredoxin domain
MNAAGAHLHADTGNHNHPFHMHTNHFQVLEYRNATGWPDVLGQWVLH